MPLSNFVRGAIQIPHCDCDCVITDLVMNCYHKHFDYLRIVQKDANLKTKLYHLQLNTHIHVTTCEQNIR